MEEKKKDLERRVLIAGIGGAVAGSLLVGSKVQAGNLNPSGPPAPSMKSLEAMSDKVARTDLGCAMPAIPVESLPGSASAKHLISASGSYYLAGNIQGNPGQNVIEIRASHVDLCGGGFHIFVPGNPVGLPAGIGVFCDGENVTFYDGSVIGGSIGIDFGQASRFILWDVIRRRSCLRMIREGNLYDLVAQHAGNGLPGDGEPYADRGRGGVLLRRRVRMHRGAELVPVQLRHQLPDALLDRAGELLRSDRLRGRSRRHLEHPRRESSRREHRPLSGSTRKEPR
jgi:hypothetical protein